MLTFCSRDAIRRYTLANLPSCISKVPSTPPLPVPMVKINLVSIEDDDNHHCSANDQPLRDRYVWECHVEILSSPFWWCENNIRV